MDSQKLAEWLDHSISASNNHSYTHRLLKENLEHRETILSDLKQIVQKAHEDTKRHLRILAGFSLDPFDTPNMESVDIIGACRTEDVKRDPTEGYPEKLELKTLKAFFGEIFAGIIAETFSHFDIPNWKVPAYPFRFHNSAYDQLERWRQTNINPRTIPGRTGDDMLAFHKTR